MHLDPSLPILVAITAVILLVGLLLQVARQPQVIGYLLAGVAIVERDGGRSPQQQRSEPRRGDKSR